MEPGTEPDGAGPATPRRRRPPWLWLWFALLVLLPVFGGLASFSQLQRLNLRVAEAVGVQEGQARIVLGLARSVRHTERAVDDFTSTLDERRVAEVGRRRIEFEALAAGFPSIEGRHGSDQISADLRAQYDHLAVLGRAVIDASRARAVAARMQNEQYDALSDALASVSNGAAPGLGVAAAAPLCRAAERAFGSVEWRIVGRELEARDELDAAAASFAELTRKAGQEASGDADSLAWLEGVRATQARTVQTARTLIDSALACRHAASAFRAQTDQMDAYLVRELQPRLEEQVVAIRADIDSSRRRAGSFLAGFTLLGILAGSAVAVSISRMMSRASDAMGSAFAAASPDADPRFRVNTPEDLEELGVAFNGMVLNLARSEAQLRDKEARLRMILETAADGIVTINQHGAIESFNTKAKDIFGFREVEVLGKNVSLLMPEPARSEHDSHLERFRKTRKGTILGQVRTVVGMRKEGTMFPMEVVVSESRVGKHITFTGIVRDITDRKQAEERQARLIGELEAKNAEMERFSYTVSHDLKSPLITVSGFLGLLEKDLDAGDRERVAKDLATIRAAVASMQSLLTELLELSRVGRIINAPTETSLRDLIGEALARVAGRVEGRGVQVHVAEQMPNVMGDSARLVEVFQNLLENAVKFMGDQEHPRIDVTCRVEGAAVVCSVTDNGVGIDPRYHDKVFGLFERLDQDNEGTGIGLALVKRIVELHAGRVEVESEGAGHGTTFVVHLPLAKGGSR